MRISDWSSDVCSSDLSFYKVNTGAGKHAPPLSADQPYYAIIEMLGSQQERDTELFETVLGEAGERGFFDDEIGRASCRARVCKSVCISAVAGSVKKQYIKILTQASHKTTNKPDITKIN